MSFIDGSSADETGSNHYPTENPEGPPKEVRDRLRLEAGDKLDFRIEEDGSIRVCPVAKKASEVFGVFAEKASRPYSVADQRDAVKKALRTAL